MKEIYRMQAVSPEVGLAKGGAVDVPDGAGPASQQQQQQQQSQMEEVLAAEGEYAKNYNTLHHIGKGAFGFVKVARKLDNGQMVRLQCPKIQ